MSQERRGRGFRRLLAKSLPAGATEIDAPPPATLPGHLAEVRAVALSVLRAKSAEILGDLGLEPTEWSPRLAETLTLAAVLHDLGKANDRFQAMVRADRDLGSQPVRHEAISVFMALRSDLLRPVLFPSGDLRSHPAATAAILSVLGHHVKYFPRYGGPPGTAVPGAMGHVRLLLEHPDFGQCLKLIDANHPRLASRDLLPREILSNGDSGKGLRLLLEELEEGVLQDFGYSPSRPHAPPATDWGRLVVATKALLIACDVAGSALHRHDIPASDWVEQMLGESLEADELQELINERLAFPRGSDPWPHLRRFQRDVGRSTSRVTLAEAGCGSGKTIAAYAWAAQRAQGRKLFICYPTTGTATEGFGDYVVDTSIPSELVHSRAIVDLEQLLSNTDGIPGWTDEEADLGLRITGLEPWGARIVVCTADTVLGLLQNHRRGLFSSPAILGSALVFDEVHSYDQGMWETLLTLLEVLRGAPVLLMTATMSNSRREELRALLGDDVQFVPGPAELERLPRYRIRREADEDVVLKHVSRAVRSGQRVLWVSNTVDRTVARARMLSDELSVEVGRPPVYVYHSRFRYEDRVARHRALVDAFRDAESSPRGLCACTTQVAEMSLDLDAELLVTDLAPIPALVQRMGRLNRRASTVGECTPRLCLVVDVPSHLPYAQEDFPVAESWIERLPSPASQAELAAAFQHEQVACRERDSSRRKSRPALLEPVLSAPGQLREPGYTLTFLLPEDAVRAKTDRQHAIRAALPLAPGRRDRSSFDRVGPSLVLPPDAVVYHRLLGARWNPGTGASR